jgi:hypothetical protein
MPRQYAHSAARAVNHHARLTLAPVPSALARAHQRPQQPQRSAIRTDASGSHPTVHVGCDFSSIAVHPGWERPEASGSGSDADGSSIPLGGPGYRTILRASLTVSRRGDPSEIEADQVADRVLRLPGPGPDASRTSTPPAIVGKVVRQARRSRARRTNPAARAPKGWVPTGPCPNPWSHESRHLAMAGSHCPRRSARSSSPASDATSATSACTPILRPGSWRGHSRRGPSR